MGDIVTFLYRFHSGSGPFIPSKAQQMFIFNLSKLSTTKETSFKDQVLEYLNALFRHFSVVFLGVSVGFFLSD